MAEVHLLASAHSKAFHHVGRAMVLLNREGDDAIYISASEGLIQKRACRFGDVTVSPKPCRETPTDLDCII